MGGGKTDALNLTDQAYLRALTYPKQVYHQVTVTVGASTGYASSSVTQLLVVCPSTPTLPNHANPQNFHDNNGSMVLR